MEMQNVTVRFPVDEVDRLRQLAAKKGVSVSEVVRELLRDNQGEILTDDEQFIRLECQMSEMQNQMGVFHAETKSQIQHLSESIASLVGFLHQQEEEQRPRPNSRFVMATLIMTRAVMEMTINQSSDHKSAYAPLIERYKALAKGETPPPTKG